MRFVVLLDLLIDKEQALKVVDDYSKFIEEHTGITPVFWLERRDFSVVPTVPDSDGDLKPTYKYRQELCTDIHKRYGDYGTDYVVMWVHRDNFLFKGVWGVAWSYLHYKYNFLLCRWDSKNKTNSFNTLFHEAEHPHNTTIKRELGIDINPILADVLEEKGFNFDRDYVHGESEQFKYIGRRGYVRDGRMLEILAPYLRSAFGKRKEKHEAYQKSLLKEYIKLLSRFVELLIRKKDKRPDHAK